MDRQDDPQPFKEVVKVTTPKPQPQPVSPIENPRPATLTEDTIVLSFYGTDFSGTVGSKRQLKLQDLSERTIANAWEDLSAGQYNALLSQCLVFRHQRRLNDWAYLQLLDQASTTVFGQKGNEATLLMAWLYCQSGYQMRMARGDDNLYMLFACENIIYETVYYEQDNTKYYPYEQCDEDDMEVCMASFPQEQALSLQMMEQPLLALLPTANRTLRSQRYPELSVDVSVNLNLLGFFSNYPKGGLSESFPASRWAMYANAPMSEEVKRQLYPQLIQHLTGKSEQEVVEELLNFVQTAFVYEYDDTVWGEDRAFFAEETLFYPYSDCEDRSILFSRLVRDLTGLDVVLLYYPGHLATAVKFSTAQPHGDYLSLPDGNYFIADPTYENAEVGMSMPQVRDLEITVIRILK